MKKAFNFITMNDTIMKAYNNYRGKLLTEVPLINNP